MQTVECEEKEGAWTLWLRRPDKANALTRDMLEALLSFVDAAEAHARVLILRGEGRVFSAGADLEEAEAGLTTHPVWEALSGAIAKSPALTISALNGSLAGGALGMVLACDLRVSVPEAKIFYPVMKRGFLPQPSDPGRLAALVGPSRARLFLMAGAKWTAEEAFAFGLIDRIVPGEEMDATLAALTSDSLAAPEPIFSEIAALCRP